VLLKDSKDGVMCKVGITDYSVGGSYCTLVRGEGGRGEKDEMEKGRGR
jgi:hypothetical protein